MPKHTEGPWEVIEVDDARRSSNEFPLVVRFSDALLLRRFHTSGVALAEEDNANAALIAAAPDLLASLEALFEHCAMVHKHWGDGSNQQEADAAIQAGRAALQKAKGE